MNYKKNFIIVLIILSIFEFFIEIIKKSKDFNKDGNYIGQLGDNITEENKTKANNAIQINNTIHIGINITKENNTKDNNTIQSNKTINIIEENNTKDNNTIQSNNSIHIGINIDKKYFYPCLVLLTSLFINKNPTSIYSIHILIADDIKEENINKIYSLKEKYGKEKINLSFHNMKNDFQKKKYRDTNLLISTATYYRIAFPSLLPNVDKIIYIDSDVVNFVDLTEMYNLKFKNKTYFMGSLDKIEMIKELKSMGINNNKYYMNAGILLMNLKAMREDEIEQKLRNYINSRVLNHHDQTAINVLCYNNIEIISYKYAIFSFKSYESLVLYNNNQSEGYRYNEAELKQAFYEPTLLHYGGYVKPWHNQEYPKLYREYWWYYAKQSGFYEEILNNYKFKEENVEQILKKIPEDGGLLKRNYKKLK